MNAFFHQPVVVSLVKGALAGWGAAAAVDYQAFRNWKTWHDVETYDWGVASFRWAQGALAGGLIAAGIVAGMGWLS